MSDEEVQPVVDEKLLEWAKLFLRNYIAGKYEKLHNFNRFSIKRQTALAQVATPALRSRSSKVRRHAAWIVSMLEVVDDEAVPRLCKMLKDRIHLVRMAAAWALKERADDSDEAIPHLVKALSDRNDGVVFAVISAIEAYGERAASAVEPLLQLFPSASKFRLRDGILETLSEIAPENRKVQRLLEKELLNPEEDYRFTATHGISKRKTIDDAVVDRLLLNLQDSDPSLVMLTAWMLGKKKLQTEKLVPELLSALKRVHWMRIEHSELQEQEYISIRPDFEETLKQTMPPPKDDPDYEDFRLKFLMYSFHPDPTKKAEWIDEIISHPWYLKIQRRRFGFPASTAQRQAIDEKMTEARQKFAVRMLKNPTLGVDPTSYFQLPRFIKNHCRNIAWSLHRSRKRRQSRVTSHDVNLIPNTFNPNQEEQQELIQRLFQFIETNLSSEQQAVAKCRWFNKLTIAETATALRLTPSQIKTREKKARAALEKQFRPESCNSE